MHACMHAQRNVSNSSGTSTRRESYKRRQTGVLKLKDDHTHALSYPIMHLSLCLYAPWNAGVGRTNRSKEPLQILEVPPSGSQKGGDLSKRDYIGGAFPPSMKNVALYSVVLLSVDIVNNCTITR